MYANAGLPFNIPESYFMTGEECDQWAQSELISFGTTKKPHSKWYPVKAHTLRPLITLLPRYEVRLRNIEW